MIAQHAVTRVIFDFGMLYEVCPIMRRGTGGPSQLDDEMERAD